MSSMAFSMYQFTRGEGALKTTQDLFTQGEYFAEEANRLYKVVRQFSYQVPAGPHKKELMEHLDQIPTYVQQLQFTVKNPTVGKAATFTKVDNVIQETKNLMNVISKVVTTCFVCATKYELRLPERLELPSLDEVRASSQGNPIGQVPTQPHPLVSPPLTFRPSLMSNLPSCQSSLTLGAPPAPTPIPQTLPLPSHIPQKSPLGHLMSSTLTSPLHVPSIPTLQPHVPPPSPYSLLSPISSPTPPVNPSSPQWLKYFTLPSSAVYASPTLQYLNLHHSALQPQQQSPISPSVPISYTETNSSLFPQWGAPYATPPVKSVGSDTQNYFYEQSIIDRSQLNKLSTLLSMQNQYSSLNFAPLLNQNTIE
ncbi:uncharacterized protein [Penaeus vannamei]|uniref:uncharacterized protein n=1 Tax=Penaeus vannamei TaxID=6689 RepID=UPI00387F5639